MTLVFYCSILFLLARFFYTVESTCSSTSTVIGDSSGGRRDELLCPDDAYVSGFRIAEGHWLDSIEVACSDGTIVHPDYTSSSSIKGEWDYVSCSGGVGYLQAGSFPLGDGEIIAALHIYCADDGMNDLKGPYGYGGPSSLYDTTSLESTTCERGEYAAGIVSYHSNYVFALGLVCAAITSKCPRPSGLELAEAFGHSLSATPLTSSTTPSYPSATSSFWSGASPSSSTTSSYPSAPSSFSSGTSSSSTVPSYSSVPSPFSSGTWPSSSTIPSYPSAPSSFSSGTWPSSSTIPSYPSATPSYPSAPPAPAADDDDDAAPVSGPLSRSVDPPTSSSTLTCPCDKQCCHAETGTCGKTYDYCRDDDPNNSERRCCNADPTLEETDCWTEEFCHREPTPWYEQAWFIASTAIIGFMASVLSIWECIRRKRR